MPRRARIEKREILPDPRYGSRTITMFVNKIMERGKKGTAERISVEVVGGHAGGNESGGGLMLEEPGDEVEGVIDKPQAIEHHCFDGFANGQVAHCRVLVCRVVQDLANAEFINHPGDKAQMI